MLELVGVVDRRVGDGWCKAGRRWECQGRVRKVAVSMVIGQNVD